MDYEIRFPNAVLMSEATMASNCHGYALASLSGYIGWMPNSSAAAWYSDSTFQWITSGGPNPAEYVPLWMNAFKGESRTCHVGC